jgi:hypothetical protein
LSACTGTRTPIGGLRLEYLTLCSRKDVTRTPTRGHAFTRHQKRLRQVEVLKWAQEQGCPQDMGLRLLPQGARARCYDA